MGFEETSSLMKSEPFDPSLDDVKEMLKSLKPLIRSLPRVLIPDAVNIRIIRQHSPRFETSAEDGFFEFHIDESV